MATPDIYFVTLPDGTKLAVRVWQSASGEGERQDILLLHGWPASGRVWSALAEALLLAAAPAVRLRLVAPDLRGFGESDKVATGYTCAQFADDILAVAEALALRDYLLVGHSMSGKIAQVVAARSPAPLAALALVAPTPLAKANVPAEKIAEQRAAQGDRSATTRTVLGMLAHPPDDAVAQWLVEEGLRAAPEAWNGWIETMREEEYSGLAEKIGVPTLVIAPTKDPLRTPEVVQEKVADTIPGARLATIPNVGHLPQIEDPVTLAALLINFRDGLPGGVTT